MRWNVDDRVFVAAAGWGTAAKAANEIGRLGALVVQQRQNDLFLLAFDGAPGQVLAPRSAREYN